MSKKLTCVAVAMVVVRRGDAILAIQENMPGNPWFLPAGRVDRGETFEEAARRETKEEAGVDVTLGQVLAVENHVREDQTLWVRVTFAGTVPADATLKRDPDQHSVQARWVTSEDLNSLNLRGEELRRFLSTH